MRMAVLDGTVRSDEPGPIKRVSNYAGLLSLSSGRSQVISRFELAQIWSTISKSLIPTDLTSATHSVSPTPSR
jgi:hypothetical protein